MFLIGYDTTSGDSCDVRAAQIDNCNRKRDKHFIHEKRLTSSLELTRILQVITNENKPIAVLRKSHFYDTKVKSNWFTGSLQKLFRVGAAE